MLNSNNKVIGEFSSNIDGLRIKPKYANKSPLYSNHPHPSVHGNMENIRLWLYGVCHRFEETIIIKFMSEGELHEFGWWKFYFDGVRLTLYIDVEASKQLVETEVRDGLMLATEMVSKWYATYNGIVNSPVKYTKRYNPKLHSLGMCHLLSKDVPTGNLDKGLLTYAEDNIRARILVVDTNCADEEAMDTLEQYPGETWYYSTGTFAIPLKDFNFTTLKHIREDVNATIQTTKYWVDRLMAN